ncbi:uncharacterized protein LOC116349686 [Contarinia nasturtii]|uniref:uncharacterized protein LOC116349686 n=1 Tax=Contarinia nasturtii TaxID=265458 RepID=UPI0012D4066C|nr:uncharacterized protein LOC116349686 [Contarinia nasturtii]
MDPVLSFHSKTVHAIMLQSESIGDLYDVSTADIYFMCIDDETKLVPAHKCILASDSQVFREIFYEGGSEQVLPDDCRIETLSTFLRSFYCNTYKISRDIIVDLTQLAEKYAATKCKLACWRFLDQMTQTADEDTFVVLDLAITYNNKAVHDCCVEKLNLNGCLLIETEAFVSCTQQVLDLILGLAFFKRDEVKMFFACIKWAKYHCEREKLDATHAENIRFILGDSFYLIHFDQMTPMQFIQCQSLHANVFAAEDLKRISTSIMAAHAQPENEMDVKMTLKRRFIKTSINTNKMAYKSIESMFGDSQTANVFFVFDSNENQLKCVFAHKCILAAKSDVFKKLFTGEPQQSNNNNYPVSDATHHEFNAFIQTFYCQFSDGIINTENMYKMIILASLYEVNGLLDDCIEFAIKSLCFENVFRILDACFVYSNADSVSACLNWIITNECGMNQAFHRHSLIGCNHGTVEFALGLNIPNRQEGQIFKATIEWARKSCERNEIEATVDNLKMVLGNAFNLIRFASMKPEDFFDSEFNVQVMFDDNKESNDDTMTYIEVDE